MGHSRTRNHPQAGYFTVKSYTELSFIDLEETTKALEIALDFIKGIVKKEGSILFVGAIAGARARIKELAEKYDFPYVTNRWLGGTLTNFKTLNGRIKHLKELEEKKESGEWQKYTKHERKKLDDEMIKLLTDKLNEEVKEFIENPSAEEIGDILEVLSALGKAHNITLAEIKNKKLI